MVRYHRDHMQVGEHDVGLASFEVPCAIRFPPIMPLSYANLRSRE
jgi:hypothetical protein